MITFASPIPAGTESNNVGLMRSIALDVDHQVLSVLEHFGSFANATFTASQMLNVKKIEFNLAAGGIFVDNSAFQLGGQSITLTAEQLAAVNTVLETFQKSLETKLVELGIFAGAVS